jgi:hypothetical protein
MIRAPKALEEFVFTAGGLANFEGSAVSVNQKTLGKCLLEQKGSLRVLDLDIDGALTFYGKEEDEEAPDPGELEEFDEEFPDPRFDEWWEVDWKDGGERKTWPDQLEDTRKYGYTMGSLDDFERLESLSVPIAALLGPPKPKEGEYTRYGQNWVEPPFRLVDGLPRGLRSLRLYDYARGTDAFWDENVDELKQKMAEMFPLLEELVGVDEPLIGNSQYGDDAGYDEENPPPEVRKRMERW